MRTNFRGAFAGLVRGIPATLILIALNVAAYVAMSLIDDPGNGDGGQAALLSRWGANIAGLTFAGEPWRLFTSMFLHAGLLHLIFNCLALLEIGGVVERRLGAWRTSAIYLLAGLGGAWASASWHSFTLSVGASGAIFGLLAAVIVFGYLARGRLRGPYGEPVSPGRALFFGALTLALGAFLDFDNAAHIGGFVVGAVLAMVALLAERARRPVHGALLSTIAFAAVGALLAVVTADAFDPAAAARLRFAQLSEVLTAADATPEAAAVRRCSLVAAGERKATPAEGFARCLSAATPGATNRSATVAPSLSNGGTQRFVDLLEHNRRNVWLPCRRRSDQLLDQRLPSDRKSLVVAIGLHCAARARLEATALPDATSQALDAASLDADLLHFESLTALVEGNAPRLLAQAPDRAVLQREAAAWKRWKTSLTPDDIELARLADCPFATCRRSRAR